MGKKDGKRVDKVKVDAKKAKQAAKQTKLVKKSVKKEIKELGEDDIEMMIAEVGNHIVWCRWILMSLFIQLTLQDEIYVNFFCCSRSSCYAIYMIMLSTILYRLSTIVFHLFYNDTWSGEE